jgi:hypothetical protein
VTFKLYPEEQHWWAFNDYQAVLDGMAKTGAKRVLEFGPGSSTLSLIEGGATHIDACEDDDVYFARYTERLERRFPDIVHMRRYVWADPVVIPNLDGQSYDLALIDGPRLTPNRLAVLRYALARCRWVLMPTEDHNGTQWMRPLIAEAAAAVGTVVEFTETGPLSGGFALVGPTSC